MNKIAIILGASLVALSPLGMTEAQAQSAQMAFELASLQSPTGSARYQALSGAMGAVGADFSSVHNNPAGIALFRSGTKVSLTGAYNMNSATSDWGTDKIQESTNAFKFDDLSFMTSWQTSSGKTLTFGFGILNNGRVARSMDAATTLSGLGGFSLADYTAGLLNAQRNIPLPGDMTGSNPFGTSGAPWLGILGYNSYWLDYHSADHAYQSAFAFTEGGQTLNEGPRSASLMTNEEGSVTSYDFALGAQLSSSFYLGGGITASNLEYSYRSFYTEGFRPRQPQGDYYGLSLDNGYSLSGFGMRFSLGLLVEPVEGLRLGASIYTPTMYTMTLDLAPAVATGVTPAMDPDIALGKIAADKSVRTTAPSSAANAFGLHTPWRFGLSGAYIIGRTAIVSADYEYADLGGTRLRTSSTDDGYYQESDLYKWDNDLLKKQYNGKHTLRLGLELNATNRLALRAGYRHSTAPELISGLQGDVATEEAAVAGTAVHYRLPGAINSFSLGLGYRFTPSWTLDLAYTHTAQTDRVHAFPYIYDLAANIHVKPIAAIKDAQTRNTIAATLSYRF